jgi:hypothetical protein
MHLRKRITFIVNVAKITVFCKCGPVAYKASSHCNTFFRIYHKILKLQKCDSVTLRSEEKLTSVLFVCGTQYVTIFHDLLSHIIIPYVGGIPIVEKFWK